VAQEKWRSITGKFGLKIKPEGKKRKKKNSGNRSDQKPIRPAREAGGCFRLDRLSLSQNADASYSSKSLT
jgi:hypothetical protein